MSKKLFFGIVSVFAIMMIVFIAIAMSGSDDSSNNEVRYNYTFEMTDSYVDDLGYTDEADVGRIFIIATITLANDGFKDGVSTNAFILDWKINTHYGVTYRASGHTIYHPGYQDATINQGASLSYVVVFEVPKVTERSDVVSITPEYLTFGSEPSFRFDSNL